MSKRAGWAQGLYEQSSTQKEVLGSLRTTADGRSFRYCKNGALALVAAIPTMSGLIEAHHINKNCAAAAIGDTVVTVTIGAAACTEDQYKHGYLQVNDGTGEGHQYLIVSNTAHAGTGPVIVTLADPIRVALVATGTSEVSMIPNPWSGILVSATTGVFAGVPPMPITASYYFWNQTGGVCCALNTNAMGVGQELALGTGIFLAPTNYTTEICAVTIAGAGVTDEHKPVLLLRD